MYGIIYLITNKKNGKQYVGQTTRELETRWLEHRTSPKSNALHRSINKHGVISFEISTLEECPDQETLDAQEVHWIQELGTLKPRGYNLTSGGAGSGSHSQETRGKISRSLKGKTKSENMKQKTSRWQTGRRLSASHRKAISEGKTGKRIGPFSEEHKRKISQSLSGGEFSDETKKKMSLAARNRKNSRRKPHTKATREKIRAGVLRHLEKKNERTRDSAEPTQSPRR